MNEKKLFFSNIFQSSFAVNSGYHYGCRMQLDSESNLYASVGKEVKVILLKILQSIQAVLLRLNWMDHT